MLEQDTQSITISCGPQAKDELLKLMQEESFPLSETITEGVLNIVNQVSEVIAISRIYLTLKRIKLYPLLRQVPMTWQQSTPGRRQW